MRHVEVLKLNHEAIVWQIILPDFWKASVTTRVLIGCVISSYFRVTSEYIRALSEQQQKINVYKLE